MGRGGCYTSTCRFQHIQKLINTALHGGWVGDGTSAFLCFCYKEVTLALGREREDTGLEMVGGSRKVGKERDIWTGNYAGGVYT